MSRFPAIGLPLAERTIPRVAAASHARGPHRPFLVARGESTTHAEAEEIVASLAGGLAARGVGRGTHVALMLHASPRSVWLLLALARLGAVAVALNVEAKGRLLTYYLQDSVCALGLVDADHAAVFAEAAADAGGPPTVELDPGEDWLERLVGDAPPRAATDEVLFSDVWVVLYTSGTSGVPKGVPVTHAHALTCGAIFAEHMGFGVDDRLFTCLPFFHINATAYTLCGALVSGASIAVGPRFSARAFWSDLAELEATQVNAMGSMLKILEGREPSPAERAHGVRSMFLAPLPGDQPGLSERFGLDFSTVYAQTEWLPSAMTRPGQGHHRPEAAGPVLPYSDLRIVDEQDLDLGMGAVGEITLRAHEPYVTFNGYLGKPEASLELLRNLRFHTGDLGEVDDEGWLLFRGRVKDVIRRRGENISSFMVEELLCGHEDIAEVAAVPVPSSLMEEEIFVFVVTREGAEVAPDELGRFARDIMPRYMVPLYAQVVPDLPRGATNKVAKLLLGERARAAIAAGEISPLP